MKRLKTSDVFSAMRLVKEAGMRDQVKQIALKMESGKKLKTNEVGVEFILGAIEGLSNVGAEQKAYEFLSGPFEMDPNDIKEMDALELVNKFKEFSTIYTAEELKDFFKLVASMMK